MTEYQKHQQRSADSFLQK